MNAAKSIKAVRKVEKPRPLRLTTSASSKAIITSPTTETSFKRPYNEILKEIESLNLNLSNCIYDETTAADIDKLCKILKDNGEELDATMKSILDHCFVTIRNSSREDRLDMVSRLKLLEVIEIRAMGWKRNENITAYYKKRIAELEGIDKAQIAAPVTQSYPTSVQTIQQSNPVSIPLAPGEILRSSGKFVKPTKLAGKNYFKDEVVIRNSDSGKVNPGVRDRLVQITGPNEESISYAKNLVEDTIRRNASPIREKSDTANINSSMRMMSNSTIEQTDFNPPKALAHSYSMTDASTREYSYQIDVGSDTITLSGTNLDLLKIAQMTLLACFSRQPEKDHYILPPVSQSASTNYQSVAFNDNIIKNPLQRSSSYVSSGESRASMSPLDSFSEDEPFTEHNLKNVCLNDISASPSVEQIKSVQLSKTVQDMDTLINEIQLPTIATQRCNSFTNEADCKTSAFVLPSGGTPTSEFEGSISSPCPPKHYTKDFLLSCAKSPLCKIKPYISTEVLSICPMVMRGSSQSAPWNNKESSPES